jgi:hypothetical protein
MDDDVFDVGLIDAGLAGPSPSLDRRIIAGKDADDAEPIRIDEIHSLRIFDFSAENQM